MNCFWKMKNSTMIGITAITAPAICIGYLVVYCHCNVERAGPSVIIFGDVFTINGHIKSFHANFAVKITSDTIPGFMSGSMIFPKIWKRLHPSISAASSSSFGRDMKNCLRRNVPNALKRFGMNRAGIVSRSPIFWMIGY